MAFLRSGISAMHGRFADMDEDNRRRFMKVAVCVGGLIAAGRACLYVKKYVEQRRTRRKKLDQVRTTKGKLLQKLVGLETPISNRDVLTGLSYADMKRKLEEGSLKALDLLEAFQAKALEDSAHLNSVNEMIYEADVTALYLDSLSKDNRGPLHGIPLTLSDSIDVKNHDTCLGCASYCFKHVRQTNAIAQALENAGMSPFARTNTPQLGVALAATNCSNPLYGTTLNPHDPKRASGGSGGEATIIASGGSVAGIGIDRGGSVRMASNFCGVFGFRPTAARIGEHLPKDDKEKHLPIHPLFQYSCVGPLSKDLDLLVDMMKVIYSDTHFQLNQKVPRAEFDRSSFESEKPLQIGFYVGLNSSGTLQPIPAVARVLEEVKDALEQRGHTVVMWEPPDVASLLELLICPLLLDGGAVYRKVTNSEIYRSKDLKMLRMLGLIPHFKKFILGIAMWIVSPLLSRRLRIARGKQTVFGVMELAVAIEDYREKFARAWQEANLDALICPVTNSAAPMLNDPRPCVDPTYTLLYSMLDYPAGVVPAGQVLQRDAEKLVQTFPRRDLITRRVVASQKNGVELPIGVQCVAMKHRDEIALRLMREVRDALSE